jgi:hypothetical protein
MPTPAPRFPLNAPGDFFVEDGMCIACEAPEHEAPDLMAHSEGADSVYHCYFRRQPETPEELEHAIRAVCVSCCDAVQYGGSDPKVFARMRQLKQPGGWNSTAASSR